MKYLYKNLRSLLAPLSTGLLPGNCRLCMEPLADQHYAYCDTCVTELPYLNDRCLCCANPLTHSGICGACQKKPPSFRRCIAAFHYQPPISASIMRIKRDPHSPELKQLCSLLTRVLISSYADSALPNIIVPLPLHWLKQTQRGFNQTHMMANILSTYLTSVEIRSDLCTRKKHTKAQHLQGKQQRLKSMQGAFVFSGNTPIDGQSIALVDDVVTTGATANAAAASLVAAGAKSVDIWCIARTGWQNDAQSIKI